MNGSLATQLDLAKIHQLDLRAPNNDELLADFLRGNRAAAATIWDRHAGMVGGVLRRTLGADSEVEDLVQEVFVAFLRSAASLHEPSALESFLFGIAVRVALKALRRRKVRRWVQLTSDGQLPEVATDGADASARQALLALYRVLDRLEARARIAFVLRFMEGKPLSQVARALRVSEPTAKRASVRGMGRVLALAHVEPSLAVYLEGRDALRRSR